MNLENILNTDLRYKIIFYLKDVLKSSISKINNVDEFIKFFFKDFKCTDELKELDEEVLYVNLAASKAISQLAWNAYQNNGLYKDCHINAQYLEKIYFIMGNSNLYTNYLDKFKLGTEFLENVLIEMLSRYIIIHCILYYKEIDNLMFKSCIYCDCVVIGDICSVCEGNSFVLKDKSGDPMTFDFPFITDNVTDLKNQDLSSSSSNPTDCLESVSDSIKTKDNDELNSTINISDYTEKIVSDSAIELNHKSRNQEVFHGSNLTSFNDSFGLPEDKNQASKEYKDLNSSENISKLSPDFDLATEIEQTKETFWECKSCSFNKNKEHMQFCSVCLFDKQSQIDSENKNMDKISVTEDKILIEKENFNIEGNSDKWSCNQCSFKNDKTDLLCSLCYANNPYENTSHDVEDTWNCSKCKMKNPFDRYRCHQCDGLAGFFDKWVCEKCSFFNEKLDRNCYVCDLVNSNLIKCKKCEKNDVIEQDNEFCTSCIKENNYRGYGTSTPVNDISSNTSSRNEQDGKYSKNRIPIEEASNKITGKDSKLKQFHWYCINKKCSAINFSMAKYCSKCFVKNECASSNSFFIVLKNDKEVKMCRNCESVYVTSYCHCHKMMVTQV